MTQGGASNLKALQEGFQNRMMTHPGTKSSLKDSQDSIAASVEGPGEDPLLGLNVYREGYSARLVDIAQGDFEKLCAYLGEPLFETLITEFIEAHPSSHFSIRYFAADLPGFLGRAPQYKNRPELNELAALEWAFGLASDAKDAPVLEQSHLAKVPQEAWPGLVLIPQPSLQILRFKTNIIDIWHHLGKGEPPPDVTPLEDTTAYAIWRKGTDSHYHSLLKHEEDLLEGLLNGYNFAQLCEKLINYVEEDRIAPVAIHAVLQWISEAMLADYSLSEV